MMIRTLGFIFMVGVVAARPSTAASVPSIMYVVPGDYYPYNLGLRSLEGEPITNVISPEAGTPVEVIKTPEIIEPILHLGGVPVPTVESKVVEEPVKEVKETETIVEEATTESLPVKESETADVTETVEVAMVPEEALVIEEVITEKPVVVEVVTEKDEKKDLSTVISLVKPLSQYVPFLSWFPTLPSWFPYQFGKQST